MIRAPAAERKAALISVESGSVELRCRTLFAFDSRRSYRLAFPTFDSRKSDPCTQRVNSNRDTQFPVLGIVADTRPRWARNLYPRLQTSRLTDRRGYVSHLSGVRSCMVL
jgi:hypothetical protein